LARRTDVRFVRAETAAAMAEIPPAPAPTNPRTSTMLIADAG
jgi:hypothetical protein